MSPYFLSKHHAPSVLWAWLSHAQTTGAEAPPTDAKSWLTLPDAMHCACQASLSLTVSRSGILPSAHRQQNLNPYSANISHHPKACHISQSLCDQGHLSPDQPAPCYLFASSAACNSLSQSSIFNVLHNCYFLQEVSPGSSL